MNAPFHPPVVVDKNADDEGIPLVVADPSLLVGDLFQQAKILTARNDVEAIAAWCSEYRRAPGGKPQGINDKPISKETFRKYRREGMRLCYWAWFIKGVAVSSLRREDYIDYRDFLGRGRSALPDPGIAERPETIDLSNPQQIKAVGLWDLRSLFSDRAMSPQSQDNVMRVVRSLIDFLYSNEYLSSNPLKSKLKSVGAEPIVQVSRSLDEESWMAVQDGIEGLPESSQWSAFEKCRLRLIFELTFRVAARRSDVVWANMADFEFIPDGDFTAWWWRLDGKGHRDKSLPLVASTVTALEKYRISLGLPGRVSPREDGPLLRSSRGTRLSDRQMHNIVKKMFSLGENVLRARGLPDHAARLAEASTHWMKHTAVNHMLDHGATPTETQDMARHRSFETTRIYVDKPRARNLVTMTRRVFDDDSLPAVRVVGAKPTTGTGD